MRNSPPSENESGVTFNTPMINPCRETSNTRLPTCQILSRIMIQTNTWAALFEGVAWYGAYARFALEEIPRNRTLALLACVATYQLALCDDMTFHPGIHLAPLCATAQIQFAIKSEDLERIPMRARGRTRTFVIGLAKIICAVHAFWP